MPRGRPSQSVEAWTSSIEGVICESRLQQIAHTVKFTKHANMITLKKSLIAQSQKLVTAYTRPQVRIVSCNFSDNYNIKRNTTMNVNRSQKHGLNCMISLSLIAWYHSSKIKDHKNNCNTSYIDPFQLKICQESIFLHLFSVWNEIFLS